MNTSESFVNLSRLYLLEYPIPCYFVHWNEWKFHDVNIICPTNNRNLFYFALFYLTRKREIQLIKADSINKFLVYIFVLSNNSPSHPKMCFDNLVFLRFHVQPDDQNRNFKTGIFPEWKKRSKHFPIEKASRNGIMDGMFSVCCLSCSLWDPWGFYFVKEKKNKRENSKNLFFGI